MPETIEDYGREWMDKRHGPNAKRRDCVDVMVKTLVRDLAVTSVLDLGCGACNFANAFKMYGCSDVTAVDGSSFAAETARSDIDFFQHNLCTPLREALGFFELVLCVEVIEHIEADYEDIVLDNIVKHASKWVVFTGAAPDQVGIGHVNCRPKQYWIDKFEALGFDRVQSDALEVEWKRGKVKNWYLDNLLILKRG